MRYRLVVMALVVWMAGTTGFVRAADEEKFDGYAEWRLYNVLIVDGQRVSLAPAGKFKGEGEATDFATVPLGYEVSGKGTRLADGRLLASEMEAKPNGTAAFENEVNQASADMETNWLKAGFVAEQSADGATKNIGRLLTDGPDVARVRGIVNRLVPPHLDPSAFRVYVVENQDWNAFACPNGMIVVYDSLLHDSSDDEMAIILGHELVHATHEHARREFKNAMIVELIALGVEATAEVVDSKKAKEIIGLASGFTLLAWKNGYGRDKEDQADRVGLRYAYEAGYDVRVGPPLWNRFAGRYGESNAVVNFFFGDHSRALDRAKNLQREIALNYSTPVSAIAPAGTPPEPQPAPPPEQRMRPASASPASTPVPSTTPSPRSLAPASRSQESVLLSVNSIAGVSNNPPVKTVFTLSGPGHISKVLTYHWNGGSGSPPGTIGLRNTQTGAMAGRWTAAGSSGYDTTPGASWPLTSFAPPYRYWSVQPDCDLPAGTYEILDSDPATWSYTADTGNRGIAFVFGWVSAAARALETSRLHEKRGA